LALAIDQYKLDRTLERFEHYDMLSGRQAQRPLTIFNRPMATMFCAYGYLD
jgi:hypothetical protein